MMRSLRLLLLLCLIALIPVANAGSAAPISIPPNVGCTDFLRALQMKPPGVRFVKCEPDQSRQGKPLRATYSVAGTHAAAVEAFFARSANLPLLRMSCCQWDGPPGQFTDRDGRVYTVHMASQETSVKYRKQWRNIPIFEVVVETLTEEI